MGFAGLPALVLIDCRRRAIALLTERDIVDYFARPGFETGCKAALVARSAPNDELPQCSSCDRLSTVMQRMNEENLRAVLVVDGDVGLGLLTQDVVAAAIAKVETE
jgi:CBS domain-containing protein